MVLLLAAILYGNALWGIWALYYVVNCDWTFCICGHLCMRTAVPCGSVATKLQLDSVIFSDFSNYFKEIYRLLDSLMYWLAEWLAGSAWLADWLTDKLVDWLIDRLYDLLTYWWTAGQTDKIKNVQLGIMKIHRETERDRQTDRDREREKHT